MLVSRVKLSSGASLAYQLTRPGGAGEGKTVIVLEAKDLASGASKLERDVQVTDVKLGVTAGTSLRSASPDS